MQEKRQFQVEEDSYQIELEDYIEELERKVSTQGSPATSMISPLPYKLGLEIGEGNTPQSSDNCTMPFWLNESLLRK